MIGACVGSLVVTYGCSGRAAKRHPLQPLVSPQYITHPHRIPFPASISILILRLRSEERILMRAQDACWHC